MPYFSILIHENFSLCIRKKKITSFMTHKYEGPPKYMY